MRKVFPNKILTRSATGRASARAFTLAEMLIVISIIILFLAMALPAFNILSGSKSISGAENQVAAFVGRARAEALGVQAIRGVGFYENATTGRFGLAIVHQPFTDPTTLAAFNPNATSYSAGTYVTYQPSNTVLYYVAKQNLTGTPVSPPPVGGDDGNWAQTDANVIDATSDDDMLQLPAGVGAQLLNNCTFQGSTTTRTSNGYVSYGAILFDGSGKLTSKPISICHSGIIGTRANLVTTATSGENLPSSSSTQVVRSQVGLVLFDLNAYQGAGGSLQYQGIFKGPAAAYPSAEAAQELWLDKNATPLLINRYNGTLVKGE